MAASQLPAVPVLAYSQFVADHAKELFPDGMNTQIIGSGMLSIEGKKPYDMPIITLSLMTKKSYEDAALIGVTSPIQTFTGLDVPVTDAQIKDIQKSILKATAKHPNASSLFYTTVSSNIRKAIQAMAANEVRLRQHISLNCTIIEVVNTRSYDGCLVWRFWQQNNSHNHVKVAEKRNSA